MDTKLWLSRAFKIDQQIKSKMEQIDLWQSIANKTKLNNSAMKSLNKDIKSRIEEYCSKIGEIQTEIENQLIKLIDTQKEIEDTIAKIPNITSRVLLEQRYVLCKSWEEISEFMGYCAEYTKRDLHRQALCLMENFLPTY